jgi:hypothetical protein
MRRCPYRLALAEQWVSTDNRVRKGERELAVIMALLRSVLCVRSACSEHVCMAQVEAMSEGEFMNYVLDQVRTGQRQAYGTLTDAELEAIEEERIGEHFSRYPFLY